MRDSANTNGVPADAVYKEVVVIGNGPAGLSLSYMLAGNWPYYNGKKHPDEMLTARLRSTYSTKSLVEQDLRFLAEGLEGRSSNPVSVLLDQLSHPCADQGVDLPPLVEWRHNPEYAIDHIVLGKGPPGGAWQAMDGNVLTISLNSWMELPGLDFRSWESVNTGMISGAARRVPVSAVAAYYRDYVKRMKLSRFFRDNILVTSVTQLVPSQDTVDKDEQVTGVSISDYSTLWLVEGHDITNNSTVTYVCQRVVLAMGSTDSRNQLGVPGELSHPNWVFHDLKSFENGLDTLVKENSDVRNGVRQVDPVLIVGAGLSAADAVLSARFRSLPIIHVFRRSNVSLDKTLPENMYPEYHKVHQMMSDQGGGYQDYCAYQEHKVIEISELPDKKVRIISPSGIITSHQVSLMAVLIGTRPDLSFLPHEYQDGKNLGVKKDMPIDCRNNPLAVDAWSHCLKHGPPGLYALGPLVGDNFVRFIIGGALAITSHIYKEKEDQKEALLLRNQ